MGSVWWLSGLGCSLVLAQEPQAAPVVVGVPAVFAEAVRAPLQQLFADSVTLQPVANLGAQAPADVEVFLLFDEWTLARLQASQALAPAGPTAATPVAAQPPYMLAWTGECAVAVGGEIAAAGLLPDTWNELALNPSYRDRFGIVAPEVDGTPWLLAMLDRLERELVDTQGKALWRTLDARAGVLQGSYGDLVTALVEGACRLLLVCGGRSKRRLGGRPDAFVWPHSRETMRGALASAFRPRRRRMAPRSCGGCCCPRTSNWLPPRLDFESCKCLARLWMRRRPRSGGRRSRPRFAGGAGRSNNSRTGSISALAPRSS